MSVSTYTLANIFDEAAGEGAPDPRNQPSGFGDDLGLRIGTNAMADLVSERYNWKWNRVIAQPFLTNSWQQDYPQPAQTQGSISWGEDCDYLDINNTAYPKPLNWDGSMTFRKTLSRTSIPRFRPANVCWMYNFDLSWGAWPGANATFYALVPNGPTGQNPIMNFIDEHGNPLILSPASQQNGGVTGSSAPSAAPDAPEGTLVPDGSLNWVVVDESSQGFRFDFLPGATGPTLQITPYFQLEPPKFVRYGQLITPIPDAYSRHFYRLVKAGMFNASQNPAFKQIGRDLYAEALKALSDAIGQANTERDAYSLVPASPVVEPRWGCGRPYTADNPV